MTKTTRSKSGDKEARADNIFLGALTRILLALVFYLIVTPIAVLMRALGRDAMGQAEKSNEKSCRVVSKVRDASHVEKTY